MAQKRMSPPGTLEVRGLVIPVDWKDDGEVAGVAIAAFDETEYRVQQGSQAKALLPFLQQEVTVVGRLLKKEGKKAMMSIEKVRTGRQGARALAKKLLILAGAGVLAVGLTAPVFAQQSGVTKPAVTAPKKAKKAKKATAAKSQRIMAAQEALVKLGYDVKADGLIGKSTRAAVKDFQKKNGLKVTGKLNKATLKALGV